MRFKTIISIEQILCHSVSATAIAEQAKSDESVASCPTDSLLVIISGPNGSQRLAVMGLGDWYMNQAWSGRQVIYTDDAEKWPFLRFAFQRISRVDGRSIALGEVLFRYDRNCFFSWQTGENTRSSSSEEFAQPDKSYFALTGNGGKYNLCLRAVVLDTVWER